MRSSFTETARRGAQKVTTVGIGRLFDDIKCDLCAAT